MFLEYFGEDEVLSTAALPGKRSSIPVSSCHRRSVGLCVVDGNTLQRARVHTNVILTCDETVLG